MKDLRFIVALPLLAAMAGAQQAQSSYWQRFSAHNAEMTQLQPAMITPLVAADPRLIQYARISFSNEYTAAGTQTTNYGNTRGAGMIAFRRFEFDAIPPPYIQHNSASADGFGDAALGGKARIASGNAEHGNFDVAACLSHSFATGSHTNGARTDVWTPALAAEKTFGRFVALSALGGTMPTGKIAAQGRTIAWNSTMQAHAARAIWFEIENNSTFYFGGAHDGKMQNFVTPGGFYVLRGAEWQSTHPFAVFAAGMQIATSQFHTYNHNLIVEVRVLF